MNKYRCKHCGAVVERYSDKAWINSYCDQTGKTTRLMKVEANDD